MNEYATVTEAAAILKVSRSHIYTFVKRGELTTEPANPLYRKKGPVRIARSEIERFAAEKGITPKPAD